MRLYYCLLLYFFAHHFPSIISLHNVKKYKVTKNKFRSLCKMQSTVALTRELGANDKLKSLLHGVECIEIPCIQFAVGEDIEKLGNAIISHDIVIITSPQASSIFIQSWKDANKPPVKVVSVGKGTSKPLIVEGILPVFEPSDSTGEVLASEIPRYLGDSILYPCSALADNKVVKILLDRGFNVKIVYSFIFLFSLK
jgi:uroporphyrinogen-III synthase